MRVVITSTTDRIHDRVAELRALGIDAVGAVADLTDQSGVESVFGRAHESFGPVQVLVNKAGMTSMSSSDDPASIDDISINQWQASIDRNLSTTLCMIRASVSDMRQGVRPRGERRFSIRAFPGLYWRCCLPCCKGRGARPDAGGCRGHRIRWNHGERGCAGVDPNRVCDRSRDQDGTGNSHRAIRHTLRGCLSRCLPCEPRSILHLRTTPYRRRREFD